MSFDAKEYWEGRLKAEFGLGGVGHITFGEGFNRWSYAVRRAVMQRMIARHSGDAHHARVLDVGSGTGFYLQLWKDLGAKSVKGCDMTEVAVERLRSAFPGMPLHRWAAGDDGPVPFSGAFDAITCMDVLFHIVDDAKLALALRQFHDLLAPDGTLYFSDLFLQHAQQPAVAHFRCRSLKEYELLLKDAGLGIIDRRPLLYLMNTPVDSRSPFYWRMWTFLERTCKNNADASERWGRRLFPLEKRLVQWCRESPTTEVMVCRRR
jgi:SAM-dependent methyltransferase